MANVKWMNQNRYSSEPKDDYKISDKDESVLGLCRSEIYRDLGQLIHLDQFRRLNKKTQVYSDPDSSVRSRLTHSFEVANVAVQLNRMHRYYLLSKTDDSKFVDSMTLNTSGIEGVQKLHSMISELTDLVTFACYAHDLGHPPFAHAGEKTLQEISKNEGGYIQMKIFDSNVQNLRILSNLHPYGRKNEFDFTIAALDSMLKEKPNSFFCKNVAFHENEEGMINKISRRNATSISLQDYPYFKEKWKKIIEEAEGYKYQGNILKQGFWNEGIRLNLRNPICYIMEVADDISYIAADTEDALGKQYIHPSVFLKHVKKYNIPCGANGLIADWNEVVLECQDKGNFSKVKTKLIQYMISHAHKRIKKMVDYYAEKSWVQTIKKGEKSNYNTLDYLNCLPIAMMDFSLSHWNNERELGNLLYVDIGDEPSDNADLYKFKKNLLSDRIINIREVTMGDDEGKDIILHLVNRLIPKYSDKVDEDNFKNNAKKCSGYLPYEYRTAVWDQLKPEPETE